MPGNHGEIKAEFPIFAAMDKETTMLNLFRFEMRKTRLQFKRVSDDLDERKATSGSALTREENANSQAKLFADIHFLLTCLSRLGSLFYRMKGYFPENSKLSEVETRVRKRLDFFGEIRNDLEHVEDRPGKGVNILGSTFGSVFQFDDKQIDVGSHLRDEIETFFTEVESIYDRILVERRKSLGQKTVLYRTGITIPGSPENPHSFDETKN
ncbi:MAG: hypothetical protein AB1793_00195 [Candidatus Thermoplasmatota archaeon]